MKNKKILYLCATLLLCLGSFVACAKDKQNNSKVEKQENIKQINLTYVKAPLNVPSIIEKNKGLFDTEFKKDNINIKFHNITSGPQQTQALASKDLDFLHALGGTSAILAASNGVDLKIINIYSRAPKAFMILTKNNNIKSIKDLKQKKIAGPKGTILHQLLDTALEKNGYKESDVKFINMGIQDALAALNSNNVDAALLAGPAALKATKTGAKMIVNGEGLVDGTIVTAVRGDFLKNHKEVVDRFLKVHSNTLKFMKNDFEETINEVSKEVGLSKEDTKNMYSWYNFDEKITKKDIEELNKTQEFLIKNGMQKNKINISQMIRK